MNAVDRNLDPGEFMTEFQRNGFAQKFSEVVMRLGAEIVRSKEEMDIHEFIANLWFESNPEGEEIMISERLNHMFAIVHSDVQSSLNNRSAVA